MTQIGAELRVLTDAFGKDAPVSMITRLEAGRVLEALQFLPTRYREVPELSGLSFFAMSDEARKRRLPPLNPRTVNGYLNTMSNLFKQEVIAGHITENPFRGLRLETPSAPESERGFERNELESIFSCPLFSGARSEARPYDSGKVLLNEWRFWAPLIALFTGARVSEIAQLRPSDVRWTEGLWVFDFNAAAGKRIKTRSSIRKVPLHAELVRLGLPLLAQAREKAGYARLLPDAPQPVRGDSGKPLSRWMSEKVLPRLKLSSRRGLGFHSFRHSMATALRSSGVDAGVQDRIMGHAPRDQGRRYGRFEMATLASAINRIPVPASVQALLPRVEAASESTGCGVANGGTADKPG